MHPTPHCVAIDFHMPVLLYKCVYELIYIGLAHIRIVCRNKFFMFLNIFILAPTHY